MDDLARRFLETSVDRPGSDAGQLRAVADYLDRSDAVIRDLLREQPESVAREVALLVYTPDSFDEPSMQDDLRRIADYLEDQTEYERAAVNHVAVTGDEAG